MIEINLESLSDQVFMPCILNKSEESELLETKEI